MQIIQRLQNLKHVANSDVDREKAVPLLLPLRAQRRPTNVLHHDEPAGGAVIIDEVVDLDDARVRNVRQERAFGAGHRPVLLIGRRLHPLEDNPPIGNIMVNSQVNPPDATVGECPHHLILPGNHVPLVQ